LSKFIIKGKCFLKLGQFITEELIYALVDDAYPSTHPIYKPINNPYEIDEYFDEVEKTAAAAIFRMVEEEKNIAEMYDAITVCTKLLFYFRLICTNF
jgi:hypothetical protein